MRCTPSALVIVTKGIIYPKPPPPPTSKKKGGRNGWERGSGLVKKALSVGNNDMYTLDEGKRKGVGSGMGLILSVGQWPKVRPQNSKGAN